MATACSVKIVGRGVWRVPRNNQGPPRPRYPTPSQVACGYPAVEGEGEARDDQRRHSSNCDHDWNEGERQGSLVQHPSMETEEGSRLAACSPRVAFDIAPRGHRQARGVS